MCLLVAVFHCCNTLNILQGGFGVLGFGDDVSRESARAHELPRSLQLEQLFCGANF